MDENPQLLHIKKIQWVKDLKKKDVIMFFMIITSIVITTFTNTRRIMYKSAYI